MQIIYNDKKSVKQNCAKPIRLQVTSLSIASQKREPVLSMMSAIREVFDLVVDDIVEFSTENESLTIKISSHDKKWLEESHINFLKQFDAAKWASLIMARMQKQMKKQKLNTD